jgi:hypothetical protein
MSNQRAALFASAASSFVLGCISGTGGPSTILDTVRDTGEFGPPCTDGTWGFINEELADTFVHVRADGSLDGDGTLESPFSTIADGLAATRSSGVKTLAIGPGTFEVNLELMGASLSGADDGLTIAGCSAGDTLLRGEEGVDAAVVRAVAVQDLHLIGVSLVGGYRGLVGWTGTTATLTSVTVRDSRRVGIAWDGALTTATMNQVFVHDPVVEFSATGGAMAYGVAIQGAVVSMTGGGVFGATRVGILVDNFGAAATLTDVAVEGTRKDADGGWGRGIQVQDHASGAINGGRLANNSDAGIFALRAGNLSVQGVTVDETASSALPGTVDESGDGIVVAQANGEIYSEPVYFAELQGNVISGSARAGILIDGGGVQADVSGNSISGSGFGVDSVLVQGAAALIGADAGSAVDLDATGQALDYQTELLVPDDLSE